MRQSTLDTPESLFMRVLYRGMGMIPQATALNRVLLSWPPAENLVDIPPLYMVKALHARLATMVMFL